MSQHRVDRGRRRQAAAVLSILILFGVFSAAVASAPRPAGAVTATQASCTVTASSTASGAITTPDTCTASVTNDVVSVSFTHVSPVPTACPFQWDTTSHPQCNEYIDPSSLTNGSAQTLGSANLTCPFSAPGQPEPSQTSYLLPWFQYGALSFTCTASIDLTQVAAGITGLAITDVDGVLNPDNSLAYDLTTIDHVQWSNAPTAPTAAYSVTPASATPGQYQFVSASTDPNNEALAQVWNLGDGTSATGPSVTHTYAHPGTYHTSLTVTDTSGLSATVGHDVVVAAPALQTAVSFLDSTGATLTSVSPRIGDTVRVKLTVSATANGVGSINDITFAAGTALEVTPSAAASLGASVPAIPSPLTLAAGTSVSFVFPVTVLTTGTAQFSATPTGIDDAGATVTGTTGQQTYNVSGLVITMSVDPAVFTQDENISGPTPKDVTVTETITNTTGAALSDVNLVSLEPQRVDQGELLAVTYRSGADPDPVNGLLLNPIAAGGHDTVTAVYTVTDDGKVDFNSVVTAAAADGSTVRAAGTTRLEADPKYYLEFESHVTAPMAGLLPAGTPITITGSVRNLTDSDPEDVGPMFAKVTGNAGVQGLTYDGIGVDPKKLSHPGQLTLDPGQSKTFTLKVLTSYSDPVSGLGTGPSASGGTSATITFTPWATVHRDDGTTFTTDPDTDILAAAGDLSHRVSIDDSIVIPKTDPVAVAGGVLYGGVQGLWNAASGMVTGLISLPGLSTSTLLATTQVQSEVWDSFTEAQKQQFASSTASSVVPVLEANAGLAAEGAAQLYSKAYNYVYQYMTAADNNWHVGNYAQTVAGYSGAAGDAIGQFAVPWAIGNLAVSSEAVKALDLAQEAENASGVTATADLSAASSAEQVAASVQTISSGAELDPTQVADLYGIGAGELSSLQKLATKYDLLLVVRSRAASSLDWIKNYAAMLKPEALKIKSVSQLDTRLGYDAKYVGSLVLKEPVPLEQFNAHGGNLDELVRSYVEGQGFRPTDVDYNDAIARVSDRITEWNEYAATYKEWSQRKWIDVSFNWTGNAMSDPTVSGSGKFAGFHLQPVAGADNEFVVQMYNQRVGAYVPVTGDVDPIAFTHVDHSPLTADEHAALLNDMRRDPNLQTQHGESATYVNGGVDFIAKQFKPGEAALMISPGDNAPRAVRFDARMSTWTSPTDYHLVWDEGVVDTGADPATTATLNVQYDTTSAPAPAGVTLPLPGDGATDGANVGRCAVTYRATGTSPAVEMTAAGTLGQVSGTTVTTSPLESTCFTAGPVVPVTVRPDTQITANVASGQREIPVQTGPGVSGDNARTGFAVGQQVAIDPGGANAETGTISAFGSIILSRPLTHDHRAGEIVVVTAIAGAPLGTLAATGAVGLLAEITAGGASVLAGTGLLLATRRRRADHPDRGEFPGLGA